MRHFNTAVPYFQLMRLHQPTGILLLFWPCTWGLTLGARGMPSLYYLLLFAIGAVLMRAAGCIINDLTDRKFDAQVERTKTRPLASGAVSVKEATTLLGTLVLASFAIALALPKIVLMLAFCALPLVVLYPWMKRWTHWPQAFLGLTFNFGALMGYAAERGAVEWPALFLYMAGIAWTLGYDTIYAHQDKEDDIKAGVKSTALLFGKYSRHWIAVFYAMTIFWLVIAGHMAVIGPGYFLGVILLTAHFSRQVAQVNFDDPASCLRHFKSNGISGALPFIGVAIGSL